MKTITCIMMLLTASGCSFKSATPKSVISATPKSVISNACDEISFVREFSAQFTNATHFINDFDGHAVRPTWNSLAGVFGRYVVTMRFPIEIDYRSARATPIGVPEFQIAQVTHIERDEKGTRIQFGENVHFGLIEWNTLQTNGRDFSAIGYPMQSNAPIAGFTEIYR